MKNKDKKLQEFSEVLDLKGIKKHCPEVITHCEICESLIIDHDNIPDEYIVNYDDRLITSALIKCAKCGKNICSECATIIDDNWERLFVCKECREKYKKQVDYILKLQKKISNTTDVLCEELREFFQDEE